MVSQVTEASSLVENGTPHPPPLLCAHWPCRRITNNPAEHYCSLLLLSENPPKNMNHCFHNTDLLAGFIHLPNRWSCTCNCETAQTLTVHAVHVLSMACEMMGKPIMAALRAAFLIEFLVEKSHSTQHC